MARKPNAIFIGSQKISDYIEERVPDWNFIPSERNISDFESGLDSGDITEDIQVIITTDRFFDPTGRRQEFEKFVAKMSPYCLFIVISYQEELKQIIEEKVGDEYYRNGETGKERFYFIGQKEPKKNLMRVRNLFIEDHNPEAEEAAMILNGEEVSHEDHTPTPAEEELKRVKEIKSEYLGQVLASTSSKGGSGKSTVAITFSTLLAHAGIRARKDGLADRDLKICLVDLDVRDGQVGFFTGVTRPTVFQIQKDGLSRESIENAIIHDEKLKIDLILAPRRPKSADEIPPEFYLELIGHLKKMYDYIILDTSVNYTDPLLEKVAYPTADLIVMVTEVVATSIYSMTRWIQEVTTSEARGGMGIPKSKIGIVINKSLSNVEMDKGKIMTNAQGVQIITAIPSNQRLIAHATNINSMNQLLKQEAILASYMRLVNAVVGKRWPVVKPRPEDLN